MSDDRTGAFAGFPAWKHCAPYFLLALLLHLLLLLWPIAGPAQNPPAGPSTVTVQLAEAASPASQPLPLPVSPAKPTSPASPRAVPPQENATSRPASPVASEAPPVEPNTASQNPLAGNVAPSAGAPAAPGASPVPGPVIAPVITPARFDAAYLENPRPDYPALSRRLGEEGKVLLKVRVSPEGRPLAVDLEKSSNFTRLDDAAIQVVRRWRFVPARRGDEAIEATVIVPMVFRLEG